MFLAIDPGRMKCGWALADAEGAIAGRGIWARETVVGNLDLLAARWRIDLIVLGDRTGHRAILEELSGGSRWKGRTCLVDEAHSSEEARRRFVMDRTRGWRRLVPVSLRYPNEPYDDYVAVILAERYLALVKEQRAPGLTPPVE
jgi:RNase H-fold protein (predicted Holliday junction resolvase)